MHILARGGIREQTLCVSLYGLLSATALLLFIAAWLLLVPHLASAPGNLIAAVPATAVAVLVGAVAGLLLALSLVVSVVTLRRCSRRIGAQLAMWYLLVVLGLLPLGLLVGLRFWLPSLVSLAAAVLLPVWWILQIKREEVQAAKTRWKRHP